MARTLNELDEVVGVLENQVALMQTQLNRLAARINQLDGISLAPGLISIKDQMQTQINGIKTTVNQVTLTLEAAVGDAQAAIDGLSKRVDQVQGV
jgi:uncharacterized protein YoxC